MIVDRDDDPCKMGILGIGWRGTVPPRQNLVAGRSHSTGRPKHFLKRLFPACLACALFMRPHDRHTRDEEFEDRDRFPDHAEANRGASLLDSRWLWVLFGMAGIVAFELGVHPAITAVLFCIKLGFPHLANGLWLWRNDPKRGRGLVLGLGYLALAGWRVVLWSFVLSALLSYVSTMVGLMGQGNAGPTTGGVDIEVIGALGMMFGLMLVASSALSALVCLAAGVLGTPLWLSRRVTEWRVADSYPPDPIGGNSTGSLLNYSLLVICVFLLTLFAVTMWNLGAAALPMIFVGAFGIPVFTLVMRDWLGRRIVANSPAECWDMLSDGEDWSDEEFADDDLDSDAPVDAADDLGPIEILDDDPSPVDWRRRPFGA